MGESAPAKSNMLAVAIYSTLVMAVFAVIGGLTWYLGLFTDLGPLRQEMAAIVIYSACAGGVGGAIFSLRGLKKHSALGDFDSKYTWAYIFHPIIGAALGAVSYFFVKGGVLLFAGILGGEEASDPLRVKCAFVSLAFLAGYSSHEFLEKLKEVAATVFSTKNSPG